MKNEIRSEYIKNLVSEKDALKKKLEEMTEESMKDIVGEKVNESLRKLIAEADDDDSYTEEEVEDPASDSDSTESDDTEKNDSADSDEANIEAPIEDTTDDDIDVGGEESGEDDDDAAWDELEQYKDESGEFDLRGMDNDSVVKVLKLISKDPSNNVRIYKNDSDNTIMLSDDETEKQYVINVDETGEGAEDVTVDVQEEGCEGKKVNEDLGYTTDYQKETAMETPSNNEPANSKETYSMDGGVPTGTEKPFGKGGEHMNPFEDKVNESDSDNDFEIEVEDDEKVEEATNVGGYAVQNSTAKSHVPNSDGRSARNQSKGGEYTSTQKPRYTNEQLEKIMRKANEIFTENKQLKDIVSELKNQINEAIVINYNMGRVIKLVTENSTSKEEKMDIIKRFTNARTLQEGKNLFEQMDVELKNPNRLDKIKNMMSKQLSESKGNTPVVETPMYQTDDLKETLSFMARMDAIK
jgi:hypothetical protein